MEKEIINQICQFIIDKCEVMNIGNFEILSEMIIDDVKSIQSKLHQPTVISAVCGCNKKNHGMITFTPNGDYCGNCGKMIP